MVNAGAGILDTEAALAEELGEIERRRRAAGVRTPGAADPSGENVYRRARCMRLTALCLSGGGVRGASFCLGVLQSLAAKRLLNEFDYLSSVSGGGFIGGWLQMLLRQGDDVERAQRMLGESGAEPVRKLRACTNFLSPESGPFSGDSWAALVLYLRNLLLNWLVFAPLTLFLALLPIIYRTALRAFCFDDLVNIALLALAGLGLAAGTWQAATLLPSHRAGGTAGFAGPAEIHRRILLPSCLWAWLVPFAIEYGLARHFAPGGANQSYAQWAETAQWFIPGTYVAAMAVGYWAAWLLPADRSDGARKLFAVNHWRWIAATVCAAALIWIGLRLVYPDTKGVSTLYDWAARDFVDPKRRLLADSETDLTVVFPLWLIVTHVVQTALYVGFRKEGLLEDLDREWLARLSAGLWRIGVGWGLFSFCCILLPKLAALVGADGEIGARLAGAAAGSTVLGAIVAWLGRAVVTKVETEAEKPGRWQKLVLPVLSVLFAVGLLGVAGTLLQYGLGKLQIFLFGQLHLFGFGAAAPFWVLVVQNLAVAGLLVLLVVWLGRVNVNRFSMHAVYRNRLTRAFLGAARAARHPDPFTGFDPDDNPRLKDFGETRAKQRLFPVINMTLNVTAGQNKASAERKTECFIATPLVCGAAELRHPGQAADEVFPRGAFVASSEYAGMDSSADRRDEHEGVSVGTVLTISGAAVSPTWGYHTSRMTAFLMTLFNVRLGAWLPNPAVATAKELRLAKPRNSVIALMSELLGATSDDSQAVYLSDGGHFESLGLYEMLRRRCREIVVIDAGQDKDCTMADLGNAIRKAAIDLRAEVTMAPMRIRSRREIEENAAGSERALGFAIGTIRYPEDPQGEPGGRLVYVKPAFLKDIPADVHAYGEVDKSFPDGDSLDLWFTESQFESYRSLGQWEMDQILDAALAAKGSGGAAGLVLGDVFAAAERIAAASPGACGAEKPPAPA